jgi:antitoxin PrlF
MTNVREYAKVKHEEAASDRFLRRLDTDLERGQHVRGLPEELARAMLDNLTEVEDLDEDIQGKVAL